jgi:hypothetical protein
METLMDDVKVLREPSGTTVELRRAVPDTDADAGGPVAG